MSNEKKIKVDSRSSKIVKDALESHYIKLGGFLSEITDMVETWGCSMILKYQLYMPFQDKVLENEWVCVIRDNDDIVIAAEHDLLLSRLLQKIETDLLNADLP